MNKPELLAPAGNRDAFEAAIAAGADAVYLGGGGFNARQNADNFTTADIKAACRDAHLRGRKVYLTANTLVMPGEMDDALKVVADAAEAGVDAAIIQDVGLMSVLRRELPQLELHTSTQMNIRDEAGIELARKLGASRVTLARELSIERIAQLAKCGMELECFVHGALCICQSGQCLLSSLIGGRSANRGVCAQPCRLPYSLVNEEGKKFGDPGEFLLSPKDLMGIDLLPQLIEAGVGSLKIEGRMKSAEYVSTVTHAYREALDRAWYAEEDYAVTEEERGELAEAFSRGFSQAYLVGERGNDMMGYKRPNNRGVLVGRVQGFHNGFVEVSESQPIEVGDLLEVWTSKGRSTYEVTDADDLRPGKVELDIHAPVSPGDRIFRVQSAALKRGCAMRTQEGMGATPIRLQVTARIGEPLSVVVTDRQGILGSAQGKPVEEARTKAISREDIVEHVGRLGGTPYECEGWEIDLDKNVGMGFSALHKVRAAALEDYERKLLSHNAPSSNKSAEPGVALEVKVVDNSDHASFVTRVDFNDTDIALEIGQFREGAAIGPKLYATNIDALRTWAALGATFAWLSPELTLAQIKQLADESPIPLGLVVYGRQELMVSDHCFLMSEGPCNQKCATCKRRNGEQRYLKDRKGYLFPVTTDLQGRGHLYNAVVFDGCHAIDDLMHAGVRGFAIDETLMEDFDAEQEYYRARRAMLHKGRPVRKEEGTTAGNLFRNRTGKRK